MANIIQDARQAAVAEIEKYGGPSMLNFLITEKKGAEIAAELKADATIVQIGVYLMDIRLGLALKEKRLPEHVAMSVEAAKQFLEPYDIDQTVKDRIINCVAAHHKHIPYTCLEAEICANADCYRFIHPRGFFGFLTSLAAEGKDFLAALDYAETKMEEKHNILSLDICKKELEPYYQTFKRYIADARKLV